MTDLDWDKLTPEEQRDLQAHAEAAAILDAYEAARAGDPFPLVALQWGTIIRADEVLADRDVLLGHERYLILDDFQYDALQALFDPTIRDVFIKGNTGCGKTGVFGIAVCAYYLSFSDARVVVTRDSYRPAVSKTFAEVAGWWRRMRYRPRGIELQTAAIVDMADRQHAVTVASPDSGEGFSGTHGSHVLFAFDEASAQSLTERFKLAYTQASKLFAISNPRGQSGGFFQGFALAEDMNETQTILTPYGRRRLITVDGDEMLNVRAKCLKKPIAPPGGIDLGGRHWAYGETIPAEVHRLAAEIIPGQTCYDEHLGICSSSDPDFVACYAHGRFPGDDKERQVILGKWLSEPQRQWRKFIRARDKARRHRHKQRWLDRLAKLCPVQAFGLDVGGSSTGDPSVLTAGGDRGIVNQHAEQIDDAIAMCDWCEQVARSEYGITLRSGNHPVCVDTDGLGWGIVGIMRSRGIKVVEFRGNDPSDVDARRYANKRAEAYGELAERIRPDGQWKGVPFMVPDNELLIQELRAPKKIHAKDGLRWGITPKRRVAGDKARQIETIHDIIGRSPDHGDSAVYWFRAMQCKTHSLESLVEQGFF